MSEIADSDNPIADGPTPAGSDASQGDVSAVPVGVFEHDELEAKRGRYGWLSLVVAALFGLLYAYDVWEAIGNMLNLPRYYELLGLDPAGIPWWVLVINLLVPVIAYLIAFWVGRKQHVGGKALIFLLGLAVSAGLGLSLVSLAGALT